MVSLNRLNGGTDRPRSYRRALPASLAGVIFAGLSSHAVLAAQTKSFVVSWFTAATYAQDGDCPDGLNPSIDEIYRNALNHMGISQDEVERLYKKYNGTAGG